jgi:hypothetical protein
MKQQNEMLKEIIELNQKMTLDAKATKRRSTSMPMFNS